MSAHEELPRRVGRYELRERLTDAPLSWTGWDPLLRRAVHVSLVTSESEQPANEVVAHRLAGFEHPRLVGTLDRVQEGNRVYVVRHPNAGRSARARVAAGEKFSTNCVVRLAQQLAELLAATHAHGIALGGFSADQVFLDEAGTSATLNPNAPEAKPAAMSGGSTGTRHLASPADDVRAVGVFMSELCLGREVTGSDEARATAAAVPAELR